ncbi:DUF917 domain-containing protein [Sediminivirga luteola]|uniref:DUF917 domain-containing protein n=1 Tax=Sediminivirga luteola TaxID=1774748 RepID=A0A8J2TZY9_9MICO|nr:DUF917 domain-containing protein [Sediminivirga luteola]GGA21739.1 hypothetical protein GCM10011333_25980 [Sediminivirga luteola]
MRTVVLEDIPALARGAAVLGTGGGGDPYIGALLAEATIREHGPISLAAVDDLDDDSVVLPVAMMGAPTVMVEKVPTIDQVSAAVETLAGYLGKKPTHIACIEAGGVNSTIPFVAAAQLGLPLVDGDFMGRAFPELQMVIPSLYGIRATPMTIMDEKGNRGVLDTISNRWAETLARSATIDMGCSAIISLYAMDGEEARKSYVPGTLSACIDIGAAIQAAQKEHRDPVQAVVAAVGGRKLFAGKITDLERKTETGFARGIVTIAGFGGREGTVMRLYIQNEILIAEIDGATEVTTPDLIMALDIETGEPITTENLRYGARIAVIASPADARWHTEEGIALVGPRYFGYDTDPVRV